MSTAGPPTYHVVGKHGLMPETTHDEAARFNFLANMNRYLSTAVLPGVKTAYERRAKPAFESAQGRLPQSRADVRKLMQSDSAYQNWSALRRGTMELRQQAGRSVVFRQRERLNAAAMALNNTAIATENPAALTLTPNFPVPRYIANVDQHCMPGGYAHESVEHDVAAAANYDVGIFATTGGGLGRYSDGGGWAVVEWLKAQHPQFKPHRILDIGAGLGHNTLPLAQAFPDSEVFAIDVAAPMLRYGSARAHSLGVRNVQFEQMNGEQLRYPDQHFDLVLTCMTLHETSLSAIKNIFSEIYRVQKTGGISLHLEQPQYHGMDIYEQFVRDWDAHNNNEPFWTTMHEIDLTALAEKSGFLREHCFETGLAAVIDQSIFPTTHPASNSKAGAEDYGRKAAWYAFGARK
jgi:ubiquinone/menaquinone biosynthesis C-methylase UbiE